MILSAEVQFLKAELKTSAKTQKIYQQVTFMDNSGNDVMTVLAEPVIQDCQFGDIVNIVIDYNTRFKSMKIIAHTKAD